MFNKNNNNGFTLIETLVGTALLLIIFIGLFTALQLGIRVLGQNKARITAIALANQKIETIKNLPYSEIGTMGGIPAGNISQTENISRNSIDYTISTIIGYTDDPFDGLAPTDSLPNDYKKVKVRVSWTRPLSGETSLITSIAPKGLESSEGGGNILISAFDALGAPISQADIHLFNDQTDPIIDVNYQTNDQGQYLVAGAPASNNAYQITISKLDYSIDRTYGQDEVANPVKPHTTVLEGQLTPISFSIDKTGIFSINTFSFWGSDNFSDSFLDQSKISQASNIFVDAGKTVLASIGQEYLLSGWLISQEINSSDLDTWDKFDWTDNQAPQTEIKYQILYQNGPDWLLIPDYDLADNSIGLSSPPIDLSNLATTTYSNLKLKASLSTQNASVSPELFDWALSWKTNQPTPIGNVAFNLRGNKIIGTDQFEQNVYKYSSDFTTNSLGQKGIYDLEWDQYNFTIEPSQGLDLAATEPVSVPAGQNISLLPDTSQTIILYLEAENSLLLTILDNDTLEPIFNSQIRLYHSGSGYDQTQFTNEQGQSLFIPLEPDSYNIEIQADSYQVYSGLINVSGDKAQAIYLTPAGPS